MASGSYALFMFMGYCHDGVHSLCGHGLHAAHKNGRGDEERVTLIGACGAGRIFERY